MMKNQLNVGIIGAGMIGKLHAQNLAFRIPEVRPLVVADINETAAREVADRCGIPKAIKDYHQILDDPAIDAIVVCSSTATHARIIIEAAQAGKHIFCEKPIDFSLERIDQALAEVSKAGVKLQIGFNRRFDANFARVRQAVAIRIFGLPGYLQLLFGGARHGLPQQIGTRPAPILVQKWSILSRVFA